LHVTVGRSASRKVGTVCSSPDRPLLIGPGFQPLPNALTWTRHSCRTWCSAVEPTLMN